MCTQAHFDYTELPLSVSVQDRILSCNFNSYYSNFLHCDLTTTAAEDADDILCLADAVESACDESLSCLVTANGSTAAVNGHYYLFESHSRNHLGRADGNCTAVPLQFSSTEAVHHHIKHGHGIYGEYDCYGMDPMQHARWCQFDVIASVPTWTHLRKSVCLNQHL